MFQDKDNNKEGEIRVSFFVEVASEDTDYDTVDSLRWVSHSSSILHVFFEIVFDNKYTLCSHECATSFCCSCKANM